MHPTRPLHRLCSSGRTDAECIGALRSLQEGPLRVRGKRSSVCPGIEKGIPKASRQIDGEREGGRGEGEKAVGREDGKDRAREKQCCCRLPRDTRKIRELRAAEPACVHADHEKRTERRDGTNCDVRRAGLSGCRMSAVRPAGGLKFPASAPAYTKWVSIQSEGI